jgi:hypothetical protein
MFLKIISNLQKIIQGLEILIVNLGLPLLIKLKTNAIEQVSTCPPLLDHYSTIKGKWL